MVRDAGVYARGTVRHPDHATITLPFWHRVLINTETQSRTMANVAFLDSTHHREAFLARASRSAFEAPVRLLASPGAWIEGEAVRQLYACARLDGVRQAAGFPDLQAGLGRCESDHGRHALQVQSDCTPVCEAGGSWCKSTWERPLSWWP